MKSMILVLMSIFCATAVANIPSDLERVQFIPGQLVSAQPLCPVGVQCVTDGTQLRLEFTMGCLDQFGDYDYRISQSGEIVFAMIGMVSAKSKAVRCIRPNTKVIELTLVNVFPPFEIQFLGRSESVPVSEFSAR